MKRILYLLVAVLFFSPIAKASFAPPLKDTAARTGYYNGYFYIPPVKTIENYLGRRLTLREKITLYLYERKLKRHDAEQDKQTRHANSDALLGLIFSIAGILFAYFLIPGFILSKRALTLEKRRPGILTKRSLSEAKTGRTVSMVMTILYVVGIIALFIIISSIKIRCN